MIDLEAMQKIAIGYFGHQVERIYGAKGSKALLDLLVAVKHVHKYLAFELMTDGLTIIAPIDSETDVSPFSGGADIMPIELPSRFTGSATLLVLPGGTLRFWPQIVSEFEPLARMAVVYYYRRGDFFFLDGELAPVPNPTEFPSAFGIPTFIDLDHALHDYSVRLARKSRCHILREVWGDDRQTLLVNKPEAYMRRSLAQYLHSSLRAHEFIEVREEQNVDETHPVDIKVTWALSNRIAIIEVKWMGESIHKDGDRVGTGYSDGRARDGARQLADYLDDNAPYVAGHVTVGYLVVFDARRQGIVGGSIKQDLSNTDAFYYADIEIEYDPRYETSRRDFAAPIRIYLEPKQASVA